MSKLQKGVNDLGTLNPEIALDWHPNKNGSLNPSDIAPNSNKEVWWFGICGHEWQAVVASRNKGIGCPYCANRKVLAGHNDLATANPQLATEWHPTKNAAIAPTDVTSGSEKKVWWLGACGHEWQARVSNRNHGNGCPSCRSKKISEKASARHILNSGSLATTNSGLAKEWHPTKNEDLTPNDITAGSTRIVWWIGKCGHEWQASAMNRNRGTDCPYCSNQKVLYGFNDLETIFPDIACEWHPHKNGVLTPKEVVNKTNKKVWWLGDCGHEWVQKIRNRTIRNQGCPICAKRMQTSFPEQAIYFYIKEEFSNAINGYTTMFDNEMEIDIYIPSVKIGIEYDGINWHSDNDSLSREKAKYKICRDNGIGLIRVKEEVTAIPDGICDRFYLINRHPTSNELDTLISNICDYLDCTCDINTERDAIAIRNQYYSTVKGKSLIIVHPELAEEWDKEKNKNLTPEMFMARSGAKVWWKCSVCGYEWQAIIAHRSDGHGCLKCGFEKRTKSRVNNRLNREGSLFDKNPALAMEWHQTKNNGLNHTDVMFSSSKKVWWKCSNCGFEWQATINSRNGGGGCPECAKKKISNARKKYMLEKNGSLADNNPSLCLEWNYNKNGTMYPTEVTANSHQKAWWRCSVCRHEWEAEIRSRNHGTGCPQCAKSLGK